MRRIAILIGLCLWLGDTADVRAQKAVAQGNDMKNLHIFMEAAFAESGTMPDRDAILAGLKESMAINLVKAIQDGTLVLTGTTVRESVWAYEKGTSTAGGWIISNFGVEKVTPVEFKKRLGN